ncbi:SH3 domain-containing protein [Paracoccus sp. TK19116]|uniref:SH3 domain-containing protein n=1 Tax=Paracoccus albicereus TaxID=2922394 RepID=A0ABT1MU30_9RHOB|nr:SH3 domain-containing protein [Paracoccus albicereus]MCQ0971827.1 SH3 domain-containing protein [Paracoccus albicereus]
MNKLNGLAPCATAFAWAVMAVLWSGPAAAQDPGMTPEAQAAQLIQAQSADAQITRRTDPNRGAITNLPLPRYVSLKGGEGNARRGPSLSHRIDWVFRHAGMPLRVVAEFGHWRRVEDRDGAGGWVHYSLLSGVRTVIVEQDMTELLARPATGSDVVARAEAGAILRLGECEPDWCRVSGGGQRGWVPKTTIWGVDPDETRE